MQSLYQNPYYLSPSTLQQNTREQNGGYSDCFSYVI